jgi:hypothetical protein
MLQLNIKLLLVQPNIWDEVLDNIAREVCWNGYKVMSINVSSFKARVTEGKLWNQAQPLERALPSQPRHLDRLEHTFCQRLTDFQPHMESFSCYGGPILALDKQIADFITPLARSYLDFVTGTQAYQPYLFILFPTYPASTLHTCGVLQLCCR